ncbi:MAG: polysaccharide biosynthesis tyrosine autokinase [Panacibacter sp.]
MTNNNNNEQSHIREKLAKREDDFDLKKILGRYLQHWKLYILSTVVFVFLGFMFIRYSTPLYQVNTELLVQDGQSSNSSSSFLNSGMLSDFGSMFDMQNNVYNELAVLQTKDLVEKVIKEMNLNIAYYNKGDIRDVEQYHKSPFTATYEPIADTMPSLVELQLTFQNYGKDNLFTVKGSDTSFTAHFNEPILIANGKLIIKPNGLPFQNSVYLLTLNSIDAVLEKIQDNLVISLTDKETTVIKLTYNTNIPKKGEDFLRNLVDAYINRSISEKNQMSDSTIQFINSRIAIVSKELTGLEGDIQQFKQANKIADIEEQSKALINSGTDYNNKLNEVEVQLDVIKTMLQYFKEGQNSSRPVPYLLTSDPAFLAMAQQYNSILVQKTQMLLSARESNPVVENLDIQISDLRRDMLKSLENQQTALEISRDKIIKENSIIGTLVHEVPAKERVYVDMSRERDVKQALYLYLLQKKEETAITKASNISSASVIERPRTNVLPYFPNKLMILSASLLLGLILPTTGIILKQLMNTRILTRDDITDVTDAPILAEIGHSETQGLLSMQLDGRSVIAEHFRVLRTNMDFLTRENKTAHILITSSMAGEGKSFIATNLAMLYAYSGKKVLLMELDLRKPKLSTMLGINNSTGFSNYIISNKTHYEFIKPVPDNNNLFIMSSGPIPPNPAELLLSEKMVTLFSQLDKEYDLIILDSPPIGAVTDAQILSKFADINLYVVRQHYSFKHSLEIVNELLEYKRVPHLYLVVNDVKKGSSYRYGYGYGGYGYGYGYAEVDKKAWRKWFSVKN